MVSIPEEVLRAIDVEADRRGMARSGLVREFAEDSLRRRSVRRAERMAQIHESGGPRAGHGGQAAEIVKANRPTR